MTTTAHYGYDRDGTTGAIVVTIHPYPKAHALRYRRNRAAAKAARHARRVRRMRGGR